MHVCCVLLRESLRTNNKQPYRRLCLPSLYIFIFYPMYANQIISMFQLIRRRIWKIFSKSVPHSLCSLSCPCVGKSCIFWASLFSFMHLCTSQKWAGILDISTCNGERNKPVSHSLSCLKWCRMDAIWRSHSLRSSSPPGKFGLFLAPPIFISKSVNML